jgi:dipeptidyl aminopeptidase/acylaminoacyl peptidase
VGKYSFSPDGRRVAFLADDTVRAARKGLREKGFDQQVYEEDVCYKRIWIANLSQNALEPVMLNVEGSASEVVWSPDGDHLGAILAPTPLIDDSYMSRRVFVLSSKDGTVVQAYDNPGKLGALSFCPDGTRLAFISGIDIHDPKQGSVYMAAIDSDALRPVIYNATEDDFAGHVAGLSWTDSQTLAYMADIGTQSELGYCSITGAESVTLKRHPQPKTVFLRMQMRSGDRYAVLIGSEPTHPNELFLWDAEKNEVTRLTNSNPWLDDIQFAPQEAIKYRARDGLELEGILVHPLNEQPGVRYPLILSVHGGPESHMSNCWRTWYSSPGQVAAARGFAVFYPNYRGSTGRGVAFSKMGQGGYAEAEFDDLVDAKTHLVETGLVDPDRVGVTGRSYGGFATAWCATALSEHFAAGVMGVGVSNLISKFGTTDIPNEAYLVHSRSWPWERWQWWLEQSPVFHAEKSHTPLLILHGKKDPRVHYGQSLELYRYLKTIGNAPVRLVLYPHETHGTKRAAAQYDSSVRLLRWMEHFLKENNTEAPPCELDYEALQPASEKG